MEPSFLQISSIPQIPKVQRLLVLCCRVENFYPSHIYLEWSRNDGEPVHPATQYGPFSDHSHLYSMWSKIQLTMATEDESAVYTCRVYHSSLAAPGYEDVHYHINTQGKAYNSTVYRFNRECIQYWKHHFLFFSLECTMSTNYNVENICQNISHT